MTAFLNGALWACGVVGCVAIVFMLLLAVISGMEKRL